MENPELPPVSVIILNWNGAELLRRFLPDVIANTDSSVARVIVADNGSEDDSLDVLAKEFPDVEVWRFPVNLGYAGGYNMAVGMARTPYVVLLNSDVAPAKGWAETLYQFMESRQDVGACQPKILGVDHPGHFEYAGACGGFLDCNGYPFCRGRIFEIVERDCGQYDTDMEIDWATGAALMVRRAAYRQIGGLDESFFAHMEEIDLCWRLRLEGWRIMAVPMAVVHHLGGGSLAAGNPRKTYLNFRNNLLLLYKNLPRRSGKGRIFRRRMLDSLAWLRFIVAGDHANAGAVWRAHRDFRSMRGQYTPPQHAADLLEGRPNALFAHFVQGKKTFSRICSDRKK